MTGRATTRCAGLLLLAWLLGGGSALAQAPAPGPPCPEQLQVGLKVLENARGMRDFYETQLSQVQVEGARLRARVEELEKATPAGGATPAK